MKKISLILIFILVFSFSSAAMAQDIPDFESVKISLWPEYDNTQNLVIYQMVLSQKTALPAQLEFEVPASVATIWTVAVGDSFETVADAGVNYSFVNGLLRLTAESRYIQIEYYDQLTKTGSERVYDLVWPGTYAVGDFSFELRQPLQSSGVEITPAMPSTIMDSEGFVVSSGSGLGVAQGSPTAFSIKYQRTTEEPSISFMQIEAAPTAVTQADPQTNWFDYVPWLIGALGVIFLAIAGFVFFNSSNNSIPAARKRHPRSGDGSNSSGLPIHCSECGKRASPGDKFCRVCGEKLRR